MIDAEMYPATYAWDAKRNAEAHSVRLVDQNRMDSLAGLNATMLEHDAYVTGMEGSDYQNPYVFASTGVLTTAVLDPAYGVHTADSARNVALNVAATGNIFDV